jgi:hypothetical protein
MSNKKSIRERAQRIAGNTKGWIANQLSLSFRLDEDALDLGREDHSNFMSQHPELTPKRPVVPSKPEQSVSSGAEGGGSQPPRIRPNTSLRPQPQTQPQVEKPDPFQANTSESLKDFEERLRGMNMHNNSAHVDLQDRLKGKKGQTFAPKYLQLLSYGMLAKTKDNNKGIPMSELFPEEDFGAGTTESKFGEMMSLVGSSLREDDGGRGIFFDAMQDHVDSKVSSAINAKWLSGARSNAEGIDKYLKSRYDGEIPEISQSAWDVEDEMNELGISGDNKGYSTDMAFQTPDGETHQFSLKAGKDAMLVNSAATKYAGYILEGALENENNPFHEEAQTYKKLQDVKSWLKENGRNLSQQSLLDYFQSIGDKSVITKRQAKDKYDQMKEDANDAESKVKLDLQENGLDSASFAAEDGRALNETFDTLIEDGAFDNMQMSDFDRTPAEIMKDYLLEAGIEEIRDDIIAKFTTPKGIRNRDGMENLKKPVDFAPKEIKLTKPMREGKAKLDALLEKGMSEEEAMKVKPKDGGLSEPQKKAVIKMREDQAAYEKELEGVDAKNELFDRYLEVADDASDEAKSYNEFNDKVREIIENTGLSIKEVMEKIHSGEFTSDDFDVDNARYFAGNATGHERAKQHRKDSQERQREFRKNFNRYISENDSLRNGVLGDIRKNFPLKDVSEDLEKMIIGNDVLDKNVLKEMLGTDNFDEIKEHLEVYEDEKGKSILGFKKPMESDIEYQVETPEMGRIPIAYITQRAQRPGRGSGMKHDMKFHRDFNKKMSESQTALGLSEAVVLAAIIRNTPPSFYRTLLENRLNSAL